MQLGLKNVWIWDIDCYNSNNDRIWNQERYELCLSNDNNTIGINKRSNNGLFANNNSNNGFGMWKIVALINCFDNGKLCL